MPAERDCLERYTAAVRCFRSDNNAGLCPEALAAIVDASKGHCGAYGDDEYTAAAVEALQRIFGDATSVWFVGTGTAANNLAIAALTKPWQHVLCYVYSHYSNDESTAPERFTQCRMIQIRNDSSKITPQEVAQLASEARTDVHWAPPGVLTIANPTELGTLYKPSEVKELCDVAHAAGYRVHVDGARMANAVAALGCDPRELTVTAGVDALSFGGTKNGLACGEAVIFFAQGDGEAYSQAVESLPFLRMSTGHLLSKHRFVTAPFVAVLADRVWLRHAAHANAMAAKLAEDLQRAGCSFRFATETNAVFVELPPEVDQELRRRGYEYFAFGDPKWNLCRFMCSFDTTESQVQTLVDDFQAALGR